MEQIRILIFFIIISSFAFSGCSRKSIDVVSPVENIDKFSDGGDVEVPEKWWYVFEDSHLDNLVDSALGYNFDLKNVWYRLQEARAIEERSSSGFFPSLGASAEASSRMIESGNLGNNQFQFGLSAEYELDLWGRIQSAVDAERFRVDASWFDYQSAAISLSAGIVRTWFQLIEAGQQAEIATRQVETNSRVLELIISRFGYGQRRRVDILRQEQLLEATREQKIQAESRQQRLEHQLAVLLGRSPRYDSGISGERLPDLPPLPETGLPMDLVQRRPDIQSALNMLRAADRDMASAISNQYPRLTLSASLSSSSENADELFDDWVRSFAGNLFAPIFYGGERRAEVNLTEAVKNQRLYEYGQTVLIAFREVEDALIREQKQRQSIESIEKQLDLSRESGEQIQMSYYNGIGDYLDVLTALDEEQQLQRDLLSQRLILLEYRISLYRALAGAFETPLEEQNE